VFFLFSTKIVDHGCCRSDPIGTLARWWHPLASSEARDLLHRAMHPASYCRIRKVIKIASDSPAFFVILDSVVADNQR
jgi:hypothetical protein